MQDMTKLAFLLLLVFAPLAGYGQDKGAKPGAEEFARALSVEDLVYRVKGADIPRYHLVDIFFLDLADHIRNVDDDSLPSADKFYETFLAEIGVNRGSGAEAALRQAAERFAEFKYGPAGPIVERREGTETRKDGTVIPAVIVSSHGRGDNGPEVDWTEDEKTTKAKIQAHHVKKARELADIYYDLIVSLTKSGVSTGNIERYLYNRIAANTSLASDEPLNNLRPYELAFEERLRIRETGELHSKKDE